MQKHTDTVPLAKGLHRLHQLPEPQLEELWKSIIVDQEMIKDRLLAQGVLSFSLRKKVSRVVLPLHGVILLVGAPGTGKTSLARGLSDRIAHCMKGGKFRLLEVEPHGLTSSALGKTQRAVTELFSQTIAEAAAAGPTIVLLDEVETLAADRSRMSLEANPIDVHRATDAVLVALDDLAEQYPHILFIATSNFPQAIDTAFTSRCDLVVEIPLPGATACAEILRSCLTGLAEVFPEMARLEHARGFERCAEECVGLDGRTIRKVVANALASSPQVALHPETVTIDLLLEAARSAKVARGHGRKERAK